MIISKTIFAAIAFMFIACGGANKATDEAASDMNKATEATSMEDKKMELEKMMADGFMAGTVITSSAEGDCPVVIAFESEGDTLMYDPINLEESYGTFKKDQMMVWFKFQPLRMMNRCDKANPVNVIDMKARM